MYLKFLARYLVTVVVLAAFVSCDSSPVAPDTSRQDPTHGSKYQEPGSPLLDVSEDELLYWSPPPWSSTITLTESDISNRTITLPSNSISYKINLPSSPWTASLEIKGGKNITVIGGEFDLQPGEGTVALIFTDNGTQSNRVIHVEGVLLDVSDALNGTPYSTHNGDADAIALRAPSATFQFQNVRVTGVKGNIDFHGDAIQNQGGARALRIYKMSVTTDYQGFLISPSINGSTIQSIDIRQVDFTSVSSLSSSNNPLYMWLTEGIDDCNTYPYGAFIDDVYAQVSFYGFGTGEAYPSLGGPDDCEADTTNGTMQWPDLEFTGSGINPGSPEDGPFVPYYTPGIGYYSPGYQDHGE